MLNGDSSSERLFLPSAGYNWSSSGPGAYAEYWLTGNNNGKYHHYKFDGSYAWYEEQVYDFYYSVRCCKQ